VRGTDFHFVAPEGWKVSRTVHAVSAVNGPIDLVEVDTYMLLKAYRHALLAGAVRELDSDTAKLAADLKGKVSSRVTTKVAGDDARSYTIVYDGKQQHITFVLDGAREYELICRLPASTDDAPCRQLVSSFSIA
jgi:hypothetical protein